jgi:hypothetical protein
MEIEVGRTGTWRAYGMNVSSQIRSLFGSHSGSRDGHQFDFRKSLPDFKCFRFSDCLAIYLPEVAASIDATDLGELLFEVGALKLASRKAILESDWFTVRAHFYFVDRVLENGNIELHDAIGICYLGDIFYGEVSFNYAKARTLMPKRLAAALEVIERHYEDLR